jgi:hypothetical protein
MARSSSSTVLSVEVLDAAMYVALAYLAVRPYRSRGGRWVESVAMDRSNGVDDVADPARRARRERLDSIVSVMILIVRGGGGWGRSAFDVII